MLEGGVVVGASNQLDKTTEHRRSAQRSSWAGWLMMRKAPEGEAKSAYANTSTVYIRHRHKAEKKSNTFVRFTNASHVNACTVWFVQ